MLKSKIHRAIVTEANLYYEGSITIDALLIQAADINKQYPQLSFERCLDMIGTGTSKNTSPKTEQTITTI